MNLLKNGLTGFQLKILALIFMTFDHIAYMLSNIIPVPIWFHIIGRLSAPLFLFMVAEGMWHTHSRMKYMLRLYISSVCMNLLNQIANNYFPHPEGAMVINNIFATMFLITFFIYFGEKIISAFKEKKYTKGILSLALILLPFILSMVIVTAMASLPVSILRLVMNFIPLPLLVEGGILWIALGVGFYLFRGNKKKTGVFYAIFCVVVFWLTTGMDLSFENLFLINVQWLMILSLPLLMLYNGQKGKGLRNFFYIYYPVHLYILLGLAHLIYLLK